MILDYQNKEKSFGDSMKSFRKDKRMGRQKMADYLALYGIKISAGHIYLIESGKVTPRDVITGMMYHDLANVILGLPVSGIFLIPGIPDFKAVNHGGK